MRSLFAQQPDALVLSGGAEGVDQAAETEWLSLGGQVWSYRIRKHGDEDFRIQKWELGPEPKTYELLGEPTWLNPTSALLYRSMLVAEAADRIVAFHGNDLMRGTEFTVWVGREGEQKPTFVWRDGAWE